MSDSIGDPRVVELLHAAEYLRHVTNAYRACLCSGDARTPHARHDMHLAEVRLQLATEAFKESGHD